MGEELWMEGDSILEAEIQKNALKAPQSGVVLHREDLSAGVLKEARFDRLGHHCVLLALQPLASFVHGRNISPFFSMATVGLLNELSDRWHVRIWSQIG